MKGVDISNHQAGLDLAKAKSAGIEFAVCKLSEGRTYKDKQFDTFYQQARSCGLPLGAYVYSHATTPDAAIAEANTALLLLGGRELPLGIFMDVETNAQMELPAVQLKQTLMAFCRTVENAGYVSGLYGSEYNLWARVAPADFPDSLIWVAHYGKQPAFACDLWQRSDSGSFPGYGGPVDTDEVLSDRMRDFIKGKTQPSPQPDPQPQPAPQPPPSPERGDPIVRVLQTCMAYDGYWPADQIDGIKTPEYRAQIVKYAADVAGC